MIRRHHFIFLVLIVCAQFVLAQTFQKTLGGTSMDDANAIINTIDSNYVLVGTTASYGEGLYDVYLIKINAIGDTLWTRTFGGVNNDYGLSVDQTADGGFIIIGSTTSFSLGFKEIYLIKTDGNGFLQWSKTYGGIGNDEGFYVQQCSDGGFVIIGNTRSYGNGQADVYLIKTDSSGDTLWTKTYGGTANDYGYAIKQTMDGGYILAGYAYYLGQGVIDMLLIKTDVAGDTLWVKTYGGIQNSFAYSIQQTKDGGYILVGTTTSFGVSGDDVFVVKTDENGNKEWSKTYGGVNIDIGTFVQQTSDNGYIIAGITQSFGAGLSDTYLIKTDSLGNEQWSKTFGGANNDYSYAVLQTNDDGFLIAGRTSSFGLLDDIYLIKTDSNGNSTCNTFSANTSVISQNSLTSNSQIQINAGGIIGNPVTKINNGSLITTHCATAMEPIFEKENSITITPNPFSNHATIFTEKSLNNATVIIYNSFGQEVKQIERIFGNTINLERSNLNSGIYYFWLKNDTEMIYKSKLIIVD